MAQTTDTGEVRSPDDPSRAACRSPFGSLPRGSPALSTIRRQVAILPLILVVLLFPTLLGLADPDVGLATSFAAPLTSGSPTPATVTEGSAATASQTQEQVKNVSSEVGVSQGSVLESTIHSPILGMDLPYRIYLPPGYDSNQQRYPVLYLLHGAGGNYTEWTEGNQLGLIADALISEGRVRPMLIVMPEGEGSYFINWANGGLRWADYVTMDLVPFIDSRYRTIGNGEHRAIGGMSMGGHGALQLAFNHPDLFSIVGAHSPALFLENDSLPSTFGDWSYYAGYDPIRLATSRNNLQSLQIWVDVSDQDPHLEAVKKLHEALQSRGIDHQWHLNPGIHYTTYWIEHTPQYLNFYSAAFDRNE